MNETRQEFRQEVCVGRIAQDAATDPGGASRGQTPTTRFTAIGGERMQGLIPVDYGAFAQAYFEKMANYPTAYCTEAEVAEAAYLAATDEGTRLRRATDTA